MIKLSRAQEREEKRKMNRGVTTSVVALLLCWLPVVGLLLAAIGFIGVIRCITEKHRKRFVASMIAVTLILIVNAGVLSAEVYAYSRDPDIVQNAGTWLLETITGEHADDYNYMGGEDYSGDYQGLGMDGDLFSDGFYDADGNFIPYDDGMTGEDDLLTGSSDAESMG